MQLDEMFFWRTNFSNDELEKLKAVPSIRVHLPDSLQLSLSSSDMLKCDIAVASEGPGESFVFDFPPPKSAQALVIELEPKSNSIGSWYIGGNTWPFKEAFDAMNIPFQYQSDAQGKSVLVRMLTNVDFSKDAVAKNQLQQLLAILEESPVVLRLQPTVYGSKSMSTGGHRAQKHGFRPGRWVF